MQLPEQKFTVVVLSNSEPPIPELSVNEFGRRVAQIYLYEKMEPQTSRSPRTKTGVSWV
jgi:hypothetical protein